MFKYIFAKIALSLLICFSLIYSQNPDTSVANNEDVTVEDQTPDSTIALGVDSSEIKALALEKNRLLIAGIDDSITKCKSIRSLSMLGIIVGSTITTVGFIISEIAAQEEANKKAAKSGHTEIVWFWNLPGIFIGIPLTSYSAYKFVSLGGTISVLEWKKKKIKLSFSGNNTQCAGFIQTSF